MFDHPYVCALSGVSATEPEIEEAEGEAPESWVRVTLSRRFLNPQWIAIQNVKYGLLQQYLEPLGAEEREENLLPLSIQVDAQYHSLEQSVGKYIIDEEEIYIAPPSSDTALLKEYNRIREMLGLEEEDMNWEVVEEADDGTAESPPIPFTPKEAANAKED